jgi:CheY-like chemotaxis protein
VVLLDIGLPRLDGYEVARRLRSEPAPGRPLLVALTGYGREDDRRQAQEAGFDHHLVKPADLEELHALLADGPPARAAVEGR